MNTFNQKPRTEHKNPICPGSKSKASFTWSVNEGVVCIIDQDMGMSVTNDAENVLCDVARAEGPKILELPIIYRDSQGDWDGMKPTFSGSRVVNVEFYPSGS